MKKEAAFDSAANNNNGSNYPQKRRVAGLVSTDPAYQSSFGKQPSGSQNTLSKLLSQGSGGANINSSNIVTERGFLTTK